MSKQLQASRPPAPSRRLQRINSDALHRGTLAVPQALRCECAARDAKSKEVTGPPTCATAGSGTWCRGPSRVRSAPRVALGADPLVAQRGSVGLPLTFDARDDRDHPSSRPESVARNDELSDEAGICIATLGSAANFKITLTWKPWTNLARKKPVIRGQRVGPVEHNVILCEAGALLRKLRRGVPLADPCGSLNDHEAGPSDRVASVTIGVRQAGGEPASGGGRHGVRCVHEGLKLDAAEDADGKGFGPLVRMRTH